MRSTIRARCLLATCRGLSFWVCLLADTRHIQSRFEQQLLALGWEFRDLYGTNASNPFAKVDEQGLAWALRDNRIASIDSDTVTIEIATTGARQRFVRPSARP
jgi:hypothetical protein